MTKADAVEVIRRSIEHAGHDAGELPRLLGGEETAMAVMARKQPLTPVMIDALAEEWGIPRSMLTRTI